MKSNNKIVLFDIDYTLFDIDKFRKKIFRAIIIIKKIKNIDTDNLEDKLREIYFVSREKSGYFDPKIFIEDIIREFDIKSTPAILEKEIFKENIFLGNLYNEAKKVVQILSKNKLLRIGIFSGGNKDFQMRKIKEIKNLFHKEHMHIFTFKEKELFRVLLKYKKYRLYLVDDRLDILSLAKNLEENIIAIWIRRGRFAERQQSIANFVPDATIDNLTEVIKLLDNVV